MAFATYPSLASLPVVPDLMPTPDGRGAMALVGGPEPALWRFADGKWTKLPNPWPDTPGEKRLGYRLTLTQTGVWALHSNKRLAFYPFEAGPPRGFDTLVARLGAADFQPLTYPGFRPAFRPWVRRDPAPALPE